jgi:hypothetical protein
MAARSREGRSGNYRVDRCLPDAAVLGFLAFEFAKGVCRASSRFARIPGPIVDACRRLSGVAFSEPPCRMTRIVIVRAVSPSRALCPASVDSRGGW